MVPKSVSNLTFLPNLLVFVLIYLPFYIFRLVLDQLKMTRNNKTVNIKIKINQHFLYMYITPAFPNRGRQNTPNITSFEATFSDLRLKDKRYSYLIVTGY